MRPEYEALALALKEGNSEKLRAALISAVTVYVVNDAGSIEVERIATIMMHRIESAMESTGYKHPSGWRDR